MDVLKGIKWFVYSNIWVSLNVVALYLFSFSVLNLPLNYKYAALLFFATLFAYNFQRFLKITGEASPRRRSERHLWIDTHQLLIQVLSAIGLVGMAVLAVWILPIELMLIALPALLIVMFYTRKNKRLKAIRKLPFVKIFVISLVWVFVVAVMPLLMLGFSIVEMPISLLVILFIYTFVLCIPFDIRDLDLDRETLKTLPVVLGVKGSKALAISLMLIIVIWSGYIELWAMVWVGGSVFPSLLLTNTNRSELFFTGWIEAQFLILLLLQQLINVI